MRIDISNFVQFTKQRQYTQYKATEKVTPVGGTAFGRIPAIIQSKQSRGQ